VHVIVYELEFKLLYYSSYLYIGIFYNNIETPYERAYNFLSFIYCYYFFLFLTSPKIIIYLYQYIIYYCEPMSKYNIIIIIIIIIVVVAINCYCTYIN